MPRPQRIQYENAFYHVMSRGRNRKTIFHNDEYYLAFLQTVEEAHGRFDAIIHAYCLMGNHYHLLIETPRANLDRIMRHINGVYTQRYNRLKETDGPLFRGRYKAILVDRDSYLLQLSRYIHRNPVDTKRPMAAGLELYQWSSYPAYINQAKASSWLYREKTYEMLGNKQKYVGYKAFVEQGTDEETLSFYNKGNMTSVIGDKIFKEALATQKNKLKVNVELAQILSERPGIDDIVEAVAKVHKVKTSTIKVRKAGRQTTNLPRKIAIYLCQQYGDISLNVIAKAFGLNHVGSVSPAIRDIKNELKDNDFSRKIDMIIKILGFIK
ncbi:MAG: transposase [Gammaproteobacteria bacterium]|nr:transposase [Gammaproteobacteria bacterium]